MPRLWTTAALLGASMVAFACDSTLAQILPKVPAAPPPKKEYVPPPPPKPVEVKPPEPEADVPSLLVKDASGKLKIYETTLQEAAVKGIKFAPDKQAKVDASIAARDHEIERWSVENLEKVKAAMSARHELDNLKDFGQFSRAKEAANALQQEGLLERLIRDGAITNLLRVHIDRVINEYTDARKNEAELSTGADVMKIATFIGRQSFSDQTHDVMAAVDRLLDRAAPEIASRADELALTPPQREKAAALGKPGTVEAHEAVRAFVFDELTPEQRKTLLGKYAPRRTREAMSTIIGPARPPQKR